jgi:hypothetical protein
LFWQRLSVCPSSLVFPPACNHHTVAHVAPALRLQAIAPSEHTSTVDRRAKMHRRHCHRTCQARLHHGNERYGLVGGLKLLLLRRGKRRLVATYQHLRRSRYGLSPQQQHWKSEKFWQADGAHAIHNKQHHVTHNTLPHCNTIVTQRSHKTTRTMAAYCSFVISS